MHLLKKKTNKMGLAGASQLRGRAFASHQINLWEQHSIQQMAFLRLHVRKNNARLSDKHHLLKKGGRGHFSLSLSDEGDYIARLVVASLNKSSTVQEKEGKQNYLLLFRSYSITNFQLTNKSQNGNPAVPSGCPSRIFLQVLFN